MPRRRAPPPHDPPPRASTPCPAAVRHHPLSCRRAHADLTSRSSCEPDPALPPELHLLPRLPSANRTPPSLAPLRLAVQPRRPRLFTVAAPPNVRATGSRARPLPKLSNPMASE